MNLNGRYLLVDSGDSEATVDFISDGVSIKTTIDRKSGKLNIITMCSHGENESTFDKHEISYDLPSKVNDETSQRICNK